MDRPIRLVCFDLGGVVIRICRDWAQACACAGVAVRGDVDALWANGDERWHVLNDAYQRGRVSTTDFARRCAVLLGGIYTVEEILRVHRAWTREEYPGVGALVERIHAAGVETAVLSNTCADHWEVLHGQPAFRALRNRHASHLLGLRKPDPAIYAALERSVGWTGASIAFFDDTPENVNAARARGWRAERIDHEGDTARQMADALAGMGVLG